MAVYVLENEAFRATVDSKGCELSSVVRKSDNKEFIWCADPAAWKRHAPVLFPLVGQYKNGGNVCEGKEYRMGQHGFARDLEFTLVSADEKQVTMVLKANEATKEKYPFDFELYCSYSLEGNVLTAGWKVVNPMDRTIYFSIGGHPAFIGGGESLSDAQVWFETDKNELIYHLVNGNGLYTRDEHVLALDEQGCVTMNPEFYDKDALIIENHQCQKVGLVENGERFVTVAFDAPLFGVWSAARKNVPFVCIEPWYGRTDCQDFEGELKDREWGNTLPAGETWMAAYTMTFGA